MTTNPFFYCCNLFTHAVPTNTPEGSSVESWNAGAQGLRSAASIPAPRPEILGGFLFFFKKGPAMQFALSHGHPQAHSSSSTTFEMKAHLSLPRYILYPSIVSQGRKEGQHEGNYHFVVPGEDIPF